MKQFYEIYDSLGGLIPLLGGIYCTLLGFRILPKKPKNPEKHELWYGKFGKFMKLAGPFLIVYGILLLLKILD